LDRLSDVLELLSRYVPVVEYRVVDSPDVDWELFPAVLKPNSTAHKSDSGSVILNIHDREELRRAVEKLLERYPELVVQRQLDGVEVFLGGKRDPSFGMSISLGLGGVFVEVYRDVSTRLVPVTGADVLEMVEELRGAPLLKGYRRKTNFSALVKAVIGFSRFLEDQRPRVAEINPLILNEEGAFAVDARLFL